MKDLAVLFRFLHLYTHIAHHQVKGALFFEDHEFLGDLYEKFLEFYDSTVERMIGAGLSPDLFEITNNANIYLSQYSSQEIAQNAEYFVNILSEIGKVQGTISAINDSQTLGTQNLIQGFADELEVLSYKIGQRLK